MASDRPIHRQAVMRLRRTTAVALALALVWSMLWGGWHRALHGDPLSATHVRQLASGAGHSASFHQDAAAHDATGHEAGSDECRLLDQLLLVDAMPSVPAIVAVLPIAATACRSVAPADVAATPPLPYQARAPPRS